jgi:N-formylglutamate amidohydrolase
MILHIPHASTNTLDKEFLCEREHELEIMTDIDTDKLFDCPKATRIVFPVSRLICDVERFEDDSKEEMAKKGMGVCYTKTASGEPLRILKDGERKEILDTYYHPHHQALTNAVKKEMEQHGQALIIDCHSFPNTPLPCNINQNPKRPDICIGTDSYHTSQVLVNEAVEHFESCGYIVKVNDPFAGTLIPMEFYQKDKKVQGIMIEVNRNLYQDSFKEVQNNITAILDRLCKTHL